MSEKLDRFSDHLEQMPRKRAQVRANLVKIKTELNLVTNPSRHECHNKCDAMCAAGAYVQGQGAGAKMVMLARAPSRITSFW